MNSNQPRTSFTRRIARWRVLCAAFVLAILAPVAQAQVTYSEGFESGTTAGWTSVSGFGAAFGGGTQCTGTTSVRHNLWAFGSLWDFQSPVLGTSAGGLTTLSFNYKVAQWSANNVGQANPWGNVDVQWSNTAGGPWTSIGNINSGNHIVSASCANRSYNFTPTAGPLYVRLLATHDNTIGADCYVNYDDFSVTEVTGPCLGTPTPGNTISSVPSVCPNINFNLSLQNATTGSGVSYQWESADDLAFTTNVASLGAAATQTTSQTAAKYYRCTVTCSGAVPPTAVSTPVFVDINPFTACYCTPNYTTGKTFGDLISNVVISGTTLSNNSGTDPVNPSYTYFTGLPNYTATLQAGSSYNVQVTIGSFNNQGVAVWIDYNNDGVFSTPSERVGFTAGTIPTAFGTGSFPISLNCAPPLGLHRMRVRLNYAMTGGLIDPCATYTWGETEDYDVTISAADPCPVPTSLTVSNLTPNSADLGWTIGCAETTWDLHIQAPGGGIPGVASNPGITSNPFTAGGLVPGQFYEYYVRAACGGLAGNSNWAGPFIFSALPLNDLCGVVPPQALAAGATVSSNGTTFGAINNDGLGFAAVWESFTTTQCITSLTVSMCGTNPVHAFYWGPLYTSCALTTAPVGNGTSETVTCVDGNLTITYGSLSPGTYYFPIVYAPGQIEQGPYQIAFTAGPACPAPSCATNPSPGDGGIACSGQATTLTWTAPLFASSYEVTLDGNIVSASQTGTTYAAGILTDGLHTWSVVPSGDGGTATGCPTWSFNVTSSPAGNSFANAVDLVSLPSTTTGHTNGLCYANVFGNGSNDKVFSILTSGCTTSLSISTCGAGDSYLWLVGPDQTTVLAQNDDGNPACPSNGFASFLNNVVVLPNTQYYIVLDGFGGGSVYTGFEMTVTADCFCTAPAGSVSSVNENCGAGTFTLSVDVTSTGSSAASDIVYSVNGGAAVTVNAVGVGTTNIPTVGAFNQGDDVSVTITTDDGSCGTALGEFTDNCPVQLVCGNTITVTHCYKNDDPKTFTFLPGAGTNPSVTVTFVSGTMAAGDLIRAYSGTDNNGTAIPSLTGNFPNLTNATGTSNPNEPIFIEIDSDVSGSCFDGDPDASQWVFEVECTPQCVDPEGTVTVDAACSLINVEVGFAGSGTSVTLSYNVNGGSFTNIPGLIETDIEQIGPFNPGDVVQIFLLHETDGACNKNLGTYTIPAQPNPLSIAVSATPPSLCSGASSQLNAIAGNTTAYTVLPKTFGLRSGTSLGSFPGDDGVSGTITLPFTFRYFNTDYTNLRLCNNGFLALGTTINSQYSAIIPSAGAPNNIIAGVKADLNVANGGTLNWFVNGSAPNRVWVASWANVPFWPNTGLTNFQIMLFEADNHIEVHVAQNTGSAAAKALGMENQTGTVGYAPAGRNNVNWSVANTTPEAWAFYPSGGGPYTYSWSPAANLNNANIANPIASNITESTTYTVTVVGACEYTRTVDVTVAGAITASSIAPPVASICGATPVTLIMNPVGGLAPFTYAWTDPNSLPAGTAQTQVAGTTGTWSCTVTDACGSMSSASSTVSINPIPVASANQSSPVCVGGSLTLTAGSDQPGSTFLWSGPAPVGGSTGASVTVNGLTLANGGTYSVVATAAGCASAPASTVVTVNPTPTMGAVTATLPVICEGTSSQLNASATLPSGTYCVPATSCTFPDQISNVVFAGISRTSGCDAPSGGYTFITSQSAAVIAGNVYSMTITTSGDVEGAAAWIDYNRDGVFAAGEQLFSGFLGTNPATYTPSVTIPVGALNGTTRLRIRCTYNQNPNVLVNPPCTNVTFGETEDYNVVITGGAEQLSYSWTPTTFLNNANINNPVASGVTANTNYTVTATASTGCFATGSTSVTLDLTDTDGDNTIDCEDNCPFVTGQVGSACDDGDSNTLFDVLDNDCDCVGEACVNDLEFKFQMDGVSSLTWDLRRQSDGAIAKTGVAYLPLPGELTITSCLPNGCFYLVVTDDGGDGVVNGGYQLRRVAGGRIIDNRNNFLSGTVSQMANNEGFCLPLSTNRLIYTSCDKLDWKNNQYIISSDDPAVTAIWTSYPSGSVQRSSSGYEMQWFNPNGGYIFRRFQSHATSNGLTASATRACNFKINNWTGNQLQVGVLYNVRVRTRLNTTNVAANAVIGNWGSVCRFKLDPVRAQCPLTKLMDIPNNQFLSCGATRPIGTTAASRIHARPVTRVNSNGATVSANRYQFRFRITAEGVNFTKTSATGQYFVNANSPLVQCKTYEVDVRASFDNGATWCTDWVAPFLTDQWGDMCFLYTSGNCGGSLNTVEETELPLQLYPNPNRGDQVYLIMESMEASVTTVSVDIYDTFGKRVSARTIPVQDGFLNTVLELNGELASGLYMVNITAGETVYTERLVIQP